MPDIINIPAESDLYRSLLALVADPEALQYDEELGEVSYITNSIESGIPDPDDPGEGYYWEYWHYPKCLIIKRRKKMVPA